MLSDNIKRNGHVLVQALKELKFRSAGHFKPRIVGAGKGLLKGHLAGDHHGETKAIFLAGIAAVIFDRDQPVRLVGGRLTAEDGLK